MMKIWNFIKKQRVTVSQITFHALSKEIKIWVSYAIGYIALSIIIAIIIRFWPTPMLGAASFTNDYKYVFVFKIGFLLAIPYVMLRLTGYAFSDLLYRWQLKRQTVLSILLAGSIGLCLNIGQLDAIAEVLSQWSPYSVLLRVTLAVLIALFGAGLPEEMVFRGVLQTRLEARWGRIIAIFTTAFLFTAWHIPTRYMLANGVEGQAGNFFSVFMHTGIPVAIVGLLFSLLWDRYRNLPTLIVFHWAIDVLPAVSSLLGIHR